LVAGETRRGIQDSDDAYAADQFVNTITIPP
jgi:hypothetical protein